MIERVIPSVVSPEDFALIFEADLNSPDHVKLSMKEIVDRIWQGTFQLWRHENGIILTEVTAENRLNLVRASGRLAAHFKTLGRDLQHAARVLNCNAIETIVYSPKLARALKRTGARQEAVVMVLELENG
jgi:hypothetical protein